MSEQQPEMPIFSRTYDFLDWLTTASNHFPRSHRHTVTRRLLEAALNFLERLVEANHLRARMRLERLHAADAELDKVRFYLRLAHHWRWLNGGQYEHSSRLVAELGRLLGGWLKVTA
ncbi:MAG: diversity-generating retroelement protein Avd [Caldilineaceae bacterium]|nr:diversity-generating retroelement protein Avd [Caldilineaceae bacterium]